MRSNAVTLALLAIGLFAAPGAHAASSLFRTYLSVDGNDSNACTVTAPCRLLPAALAATQAGGEVWILDSANYNTGTVTITQSVTILAVPGALGSVIANQGDAVDITGTGIVVTLRNLVVRELDNDVFFYGVEMTGNSSQLIVESTEFSGLNVGVQIDAGGSANGTFTHSIFRANDIGLNIIGTPGNLAHAIVDQCSIINSAGIELFAESSHVVVSNSAITGTGQNTSIDSAGYAVEADTDSTIVLQNNVVEYNVVGAQLGNDNGAPLGIVNSNGNNTFQFNSNNVLGGSMTSASTM